MKKPPRNTDQAALLLNLYADLDAALALVEAVRKAAMGQANAAADAEAGPILAELEALKAQLQPWWQGDGRALAPKGRKSMQLGGCMIGTRADRPRLAHGFESEDKAVEGLRATRYGKQTTRVKYSLDRAATLKLVQAAGAAGKALVELGFRVEQGETFFVERVEQAGVVASG